MRQPRYIPTGRYGNPIPTRFLAPTDCSTVYIKFLYKKHFSKLVSNCKEANKNLIIEKLLKGPENHQRVHRTD